MNDYPSLSPDTPGTIEEILRIIVRERTIDVRDFNNLQNRFMSGRKVGKVPSGSLDVDTSDRVGDFNYTNQYFYLLVDNSGTAEWRRIALASW